MAAILLGVVGSSLASRSPGYLSYDDYRGTAFNVSYDGRSLIVDGARSLFISGATHPPRGTPEMWKGWMQAARENGLNMVQVSLPTD